MKILYKIALLFLSIIWQLNSYSQNNAKASLDTNSILLGDHIHLHLKLTVPADAVVEWPKILTTLAGNIEVIDRSEIDTVNLEDNNQVSLNQKLIITSFDSGYYAIPPFNFKYQIADDTAAYLLSTEALLLEVMNLEIDPSVPIKDIKAPLDAPYTFREALPLILWGLAVLVIAFAIFYYLRKQKKEEPVFKMPQKPKLPPHQIALDALDELKYKKLWQNGKEKQYHSELTDIIRIYISGRFGIHAMEFTSDEITEAVNNTAANTQAREKLRQTLFLADMVKFAKMKPTPLEHDQSLNFAIAFVKETINIVELAITDNNTEDAPLQLEKEMGSDLQINNTTEGKKE